MPLTLFDFRQEVQMELFRILDYWKKYAVETNGDGFYGVVDQNNIPDKNAPKAVVINSRILWTYSAAQQLFPNSDYPILAKRAYDYIIKYFIDPKFGGVYWSVNANGSPQQTKKQLYGHAFALYGLAEYYKITKDKNVLQHAIDLFKIMIEHAYDKKFGGYIEAFENDWSDTADYILSRAPSSKSMNTHLHLLEAYTNLYRVWKDDSAKFHLKHSIEMMLKNIINRNTHRLILFFDRGWRSTSEIVSYGHDIECSWLLWEAAEVLGDKELEAKCKRVSIEMAKAAVDGVAPDGSMNYELDMKTKKTQTRKEWWVQAEAMVGFYNAYQLTGKVNFLQKSEDAWNYIQKYMIDHDTGEWYGDLDADHKIISGAKVTFWKCPYHNGRACMEMWRRLG